MSPRVLLVLLGASVSSLEPADDAALAADLVDCTRAAAGLSPPSGSSNLENCATPLWPLPGPAVISGLVAPSRLKRHTTPAPSGATRKSAQRPGGEVAVPLG